MKNVVAIEVNDKYCGIVNEKGEMRIISKNNQGSFRDYLRLENEIDLLLNEISEKKKKIKGEKRKLLANILEVCGIGLVTFLSTNIVFGLSLIAGLASGILTINRIKKINGLNKENKTTENEFRKMSKAWKSLSMDMVIKELYNDMRLTDRELEEISTNPKKKMDLIYESSRNLFNYLRNHISEPIEKHSILYLDREIINEYKNPISLQNNKREGKNVVSIKKNKKEFDGSLADLLIYGEDEKKFDEVKSKKVAVPKQEIVVNVESHDKELQSLLEYSSEEERIEEAKRLSLRK